MHELKDVEEFIRDDDTSSISSLSEEEVVNLNVSDSAKKSTRHQSPSSNPIQSLFDSNSSFCDGSVEDSVSTGFSSNDESIHSSCSLSFQLVQDLEEADDSVFYSVPKDPLVGSTKIGVVLQFVNDIVTVMSDGSDTVVDIGTFVGTSHRILGPVITLFGPVKSCFYAIRSEFMSDSDEIEKGEAVFIVEGTERSIHEDLYIESIKSATDASYLNDKELPCHVMPDFSDDEAERNWKVRKRRNQ